MKSLFASGAALLLCQGAWGEQWITNNISGWWTGVASSADGVKLVTVTGESCCGKIYTSTDSGTTWVARTTPEPGGAWAAVASSADGSRLVAVSYNGIPVCISQDSGVTWTTPLNPAPFPYGTQFEAVCSSGDGNLVLGGAIEFPGRTNRLYRSADGGTNWTMIDLGDRRVSTLCCSGDGKTVFAGTKPDMWGRTSLVYRSADAGLTWVPTTAPSDYWHTLCCSVDGNRVYAAPNNGPGFQMYAHVLYVSTDSGQTWKSNSVPAYGVSKLVCSADGTRIVLVATAQPDGAILTSSDGGTTWSAQAVASFSDPWNAATASSADGHRLIAATAYRMYTLGTTPHPTLHIRRAAEGVSLAWTVPSSAFVLQENDMASGTGWTEVAVQPVLDPATAQNRVFLPVGHGSKFYRLMGR